MDDSGQHPAGRRTRRAGRQATRWWLALLVAVLAVGAFAPVASAQTHTVTVGPELVCQLSHGTFGEDDCSGGGDGYVGELCADACQWYRILARYDIAEALPANAVIQSASLATEPSDSGVETREMLSSWTEDANWTTRDGTTPWSPADEGGIADATEPIATDVTALVKGWVDGSKPNFGFLYTAQLTSWGTWFGIAPGISVTYVVDTTPPTVTLTGTLTDQVGQQLEEEHYGLHIVSSDAESGVASIKVHVDGTLKATIAPTSGDFDFKTDLYSDGAHTVRVDVTDHAGNTASPTVAADNAQYRACMLWAHEDDYCALTDRDADDVIEDEADLGADGTEPEYDPTAAACIAIYTDPALCDPANNPPDPDDGGLLSLLDTNPAYGIAEEHWERLTETPFTSLSPKYVKKIVPFDVVDDYCLYGDCANQRHVYQEWKAFYTQAMTDGIQVLVVFERTGRSNADFNKNYSPTIAEYTAKVRQFLDDNRRITRLAAWNEPNGAGQPTRSLRKAGSGYARGFGAPGAARYTHALAQQCKISTTNSSPRCRMVLGEFAIDPNGKWKSYVARFKSEVLERRSLAPFTYWGIHPYSDVRHRRSPSNTSVVAYDAYVPSGDQIWVTEVGSRTELFRDDYANETQVEARQKLETEYLYDDLGALSQVKRLYYYNMCEPLPDADPPANPRWDSGLLRRNCTEVRPAWQVVKDHMNP